MPLEEYVPTLCPCGCGGEVARGRTYANYDRCRQRAYRRRKRVDPFVVAMRHDPCVYCGQAVTDLDHIEAVAGGGRNLLDNLAPSCRSCNAAKGDLPLLHFLLARAT